MERTDPPEDVNRDPITPEAVRAHRPAKVDDDIEDQDAPLRNTDASEPVKSDLARILTPETRYLVLDALLANDRLTVSQIVEVAGISQASASRHLQALEEYGIVEQVDKVGNARRWRACPDHPVVQLLRMADHAIRFGQTEMKLDDRFLGQPGSGYEPGDHANDPR